MRELNAEDLPRLITQRTRAHGAEKYFVDFLISLIRVENNYIMWPYGINDKGDENKQIIERVFAYEFYHQWRKVTEEFEYKNLIINGEILKSSVYRLTDIDLVYPDLILHEHQNNMNKQLIACEIKTSKALLNANGKKGLKKDLLKLSSYRDALQFEYCIFLQVLDIDDCFNSSICPYLNRIQNQLSNLESIYFVIKKSDGIVKYDTLQNIINNFS